MLVEQASATDPMLDTRERLIRAAIEVFLEKGFGSTRVQDIARRAGFTAGALYVHFPSRSALLGEAILLEGRRIIDAFVDHLQNKADGDFNVATLLTQAVLAEPDNLDLLVIEAIALATREPEARAVLDESFQGLLDFLTQRLQARIADGSLDPTLDVGALRVVFSTLLLGVLMHRAARIPSASPEALSAVFGRVTGAFARQ